MTTAAERYQEAKARVAEAREVMKETAKTAFSEASAVLFAEHPCLREFAWTQYTPYFNDGEPCEFSANTDYPYVKFGEAGPEDPDEDEDDGDEFSTWRVRDKQKKGEPLTAEESAGVAVVEFLTGFDDDTYDEMFGDHVKVVVSRDGVEVEEYSHD